MKVTFDTNVWQLVVAPQSYPDDLDAPSFARIHAAILDGRITPYLSETIFTLEGIDKKERKQFFGEYEPKLDVTVTDDGRSISIGFALGPDETAHPGNNEYVRRHLPSAIELGFKLIHSPRVGGLTNPEVSKHLVKPEGAAHGVYLDRATEAGQRIEEEFGSGMAPLRGILAKYPQFQDVSVHKWLSRLPDSEANAVAKAVAEWADGDSVAAHIGIQADYFCTRDSAKGAGRSSILGAEKVAILAREYGFQKVTPAELATLL